MRYVGGKHRIAKWVAAHLLVLNSKSPRTRYLEPFVGSGAIYMEMARHFSGRTIADVHPDLILLYQALAEGWKPPTFVSREDYVRLKQEPPSALRGFVGFGASFSGKWFGGYVDVAWDSYHQRWRKCYAEAAARSLDKLIPHLAGTAIVCADYRSFTPGHDDFVYCDPPYKDTQGYGIPFDHDAFWTTMDAWSAAGALVVVSESVAPSHWKPLATRERQNMMQAAAGSGAEERVETLWVPS